MRGCSWSVVPVLALLPALPLGAQSPDRPGKEVRVKVFFEEKLGPLEIDRMALGQGGLSDEPMWEGRVAEVRALRPRIIRLFVQEYFRLMPQPGKYHFETLDRSVDAILKTGATPLMCLCFKPRALFPEVNQDVVEPNDYAAWERLVDALVRHYRDRKAGIRYWEVGNEPDIGESGGCPYRFQPESYARYYGHTARAILRADPEARVGGPAVSSIHSALVPALLEACERENIPLHFLSWHLYSSDPRQIRSTVEFALSLLRKHPALKPETMLNEWNMDLMNPPLDARFQPCFLLETIWQMKDAGLDWSCYYHIRDWHVRPEQFAPFMSAEGTAFMARWWNRMPQFDGLFDYQDTVRPAYFAFKLLARLTGERLRVASSDPVVHGFAAHDVSFRMDSLLLWNFSSSPVQVELTLEGLPGEVPMRHLTLDALAPGSDENARLRPDPPERLPEATRRIPVRLEPFGVQFWSFER